MIDNWTYPELEEQTEFVPFRTNPEFEAWLKTEGDEGVEESRPHSTHPADDDIFRIFASLRQIKSFAWVQI